MDQDVIHSLKTRYRKNVVSKIIQSVEKKKNIPKISLLLGTQMLVAAWDALTMKAAIAKDDDPFKELKEEIENLRSIQPDLVSKIIEAVSFTDVDAEVLALQPPPSDPEIVAELLKTEDESNDNDNAIETEDEPVPYHNRNELLQLSTTCKNSPCFQKMVQLFNLMRIMLLA